MSPCWGPLSWGSFLKTHFRERTNALAEGDCCDFCHLLGYRLSLQGGDCLPLLLLPRLRLNFFPRSAFHFKPPNCVTILASIFSLGFVANRFCCFLAANIPVLFSLHIPALVSTQMFASLLLMASHTMQQRLLGLSAPIAAAQAIATSLLQDQCNASAKRSQFRNNCRQACILSSPSVTTRHCLPSLKKGLLVTSATGT